MSTSKEKTDSRELKQIKKDLKKLMVAIMLFRYRVQVVTFLLINMKRFVRTLLYTIPTITYKDMSIPFDKYYNSAKGDIGKMIVFGFNKQKAIKAFKKIYDAKIDKYGINQDMKKEMIHEVKILIAEFESLKDARKENRFERMKEVFLNSKKEFKDNSLTQIAIEIGTFFKDKDVNLSKMSLDSVMTSYEIMRNGVTE